jgi:CRISPR-associated protein Cas1
MGIVALTDERCRLVVQGRVLHVERAGTSHALPLAEVDEVMLHGAADLTPAARNLLLRQGIDVAFFTADGRYLGRLSAPASRNAARRFAWYRLVADPARSLPLARALIAAKIRNQRTVLLARQRRARVPLVADVLAALRTQVADLDRAATTEAIMGHEGLAARRYYQAVGALLRHPTITFTERNRRPPKDPFNACLSYGYALLQSRVEHAVWRAGLDPGLGVLHSAERGAPALALDLMEPFRPVIDDMVLTLMNRGQLHDDDFRRPVDGAAGLEADLDTEAVHLAKVGRAVMVQAWARTSSQAHPNPRLEAAVPLVHWVLDQAQQLAAIAEERAERFFPFTLEQR